MSIKPYVGQRIRVDGVEYKIASLCVESDNTVYVWYKTPTGISKLKRITITEEDNNG